MESERNDLRTKVMHLEMKDIQLTTENQDLTKDLDCTKQECAMLTEQVTNLTSQVSAMSQHVNVAVEEKRQVAGSFTTRLEKAEEERDKLRSLLEARMRSTAESNREKADLRAQVCIDLSIYNLLCNIFCYSFLI